MFEYIFSFIEPMGLNNECQTGFQEGGGGVRKAWYLPWGFHLLFGAIYRHVFPHFNHPIELNPYPSDITPVNSLMDARYMLQTCRTAYNEAAPLCYSTNRLFVQHWDFGDMKVLRDLTSTSMSAPHFLTVHINIILHVSASTVESSMEGIECY